MREIRIHGRGGQGVVTAAELMALAAFEDGEFAQGFPTFGAERLGAPIQSFVRINKREIRIRSQIYNPDFIIVQDPTLIGVIDVFQGLKPDGLVLINTEKKPEELKLRTEAMVLTVPALKIAQETIGRPIPNTALLGAFSAATGEISLDAIRRSILTRFGGEVGERNVDAAERAYKLVKWEGRKA